MEGKSAKSFNRQKIAVSNKTSPWIEGFYLMVVVGLLILSGKFLITLKFSEHPFLFLSLEVVLGFVAVHLVLFFHDCMHGSALSNRRWSVLLARMIGSYYLFPFHFLQQSHLQHHKHAGLIDGDTEVLHYTQTQAQKSFTLRFLAALARTPLAGALFAPILQSLHLFDALCSKSLDRRSVFDLLFMLGFWSLVLDFLVEKDILVSFFLYVWAIPYLLGLCFMYLATYPLHTHVAGFSLKDYSVQERQFFVARTITSNLWVQFLFFNLNFHLEHHLFPQVSRWKLKELSVTLTPLLVEKALEKNLPLMIHPSYTQWHLDFRKVRQIYNPNVSPQEMEKWNAHFQTLNATKITSRA